MVRFASQISIEARAFQTSSSASSSSTSSPTPTESPFFTDPVHSDSPREDLSKTVLAALFGTVALFLVVLIVLWRTCYLKRNGLPLRSFFSFPHSPSSRHRTRRPESVPRTTGLPSLPISSHPTPIVLPTSFLYPSMSNPLPVMHRQTRAADIDGGGRRIAVLDPDNPHGDIDEKDVLPAYDTMGSPPKYLEWELSATRTRLQLQTRGLGDSDEVSPTSASSHMHTPARWEQWRTSEAGINGSVEGPSSHGHTAPNSGNV